MRGKEIRGYDGMVVEKGRLEDLGVGREDVENVVKIVKMNVSKSERMRRLYRLGLDVGLIGKIMGVRYNYVYNVVSREFGSVRKKEGENKSDKYRRLWDEGLGVGEISKRENDNYNYVWSVIDRYRKSGESKRK